MKTRLLHALHNPFFRWGISLCLALLLLAPALLVSPWFESNQGYRYPLLLDLFMQEWRAGVFYPRWLPQLMGGYGYPTFLFYPPGFWFAAAPLATVLSTTTACKLVMLAGLSVSISASWRLAQRMGGLIGLYALCAVIFSPQLLDALLLRGAWSELLACLLLPCLWLAWLDTVCTPRPAPALRLGLWLSAIIYCHPVISLWLLLLLTLCSLHALWRARSWALLRAFMAAALLAASLTAPYWQPAFSLQHAVSHEQGWRPWVLYRDLDLTTLFSPQSMVLGSIQPPLALIGLWLARRKPLALPFFVFYLLAIAYMLPVANELRALAPSFFGYLQWPARVAPLLIVPHILGIAALLHHTAPRLGRRNLALVLALLTTAQLYCTYPLYRVLGAQQPQTYFAERFSRFENLTHLQEFTPRTAALRGLLPRLSGLPIAQSFPPVPIHEEPRISETDFTLSLYSSKPLRLRVSQLYFPGWRITNHGAALPDCPRQPALASFCHGQHGLLQLELPAGEHKLRFTFDAPQNATARNLLSLLGVALALLLLRRLKAADSPAA